MKNNFTTGLLDQLYNKALLETLSLTEYDCLRGLVDYDISINDYVNTRMASDIRESLKDGE